MQLIHIPVSKKKSMLRLMGALAFVATGVLFITRPFFFIRSDDPTVIKTVGYLCVVFFGIIAVGLFRALLNNKTGLFIDADGINDQSSGVSAGKILWDDIKSIRREQVEGQYFLIIAVKNPQDYIERQLNPLKKKAMVLSYQIYQTPVTISANFLNITFDELEQLVANSFRDAKEENTRSKAGA